MADAADSSAAYVNNPFSSPAAPLKTCSSNSLLMLPCNDSPSAVSRDGMTARASTRTSKLPAILTGA